MRGKLLVLAAVGALGACGGGTTNPGDPDGDPAGTDGPPPDAAGPPPGAQLFAEDRLHLITIEVEEQYLEQLEDDVENRVPCTFTFDGTRLENVGIRKKGGYGSPNSIYGKTGFSMKMNEFVSGQRLDGIKRFLLNNAQEDATFLSETMGYLSYRLAGQVAPLTAHAQVTFNGEDKGIFIIKEAIADDFLERNFGAANDQGNVYEGFYHPEDQELGDFARHPDELDLKDEVSEGRTREDIEALAQIIRDVSDAELEAAVSARIDFDRYLTGLALDTILGYWDSYAYFCNNYYLYHDPASDRFVYIPHGMDQLQYYPPGGPMGLFAQRIDGIPELEQRLDDRIATLRASWPGAQLAARIDQIGGILATAPKGERTDDDRESFAEHVNAVRDAVTNLGNDN
jgi:spore coat protein H